MVFKRVLGSLGVGGPVVDTVLDREPVRPGGVVRGQVRLRGGGRACDIEHLTLELVARVEAGHGGEERAGGVVFDRLRLSGGFRLDTREHRDVPFTLHIPWETPLTELSGQPLGVALGIRIELASAGAKDHGDPDELIVRPLPVQEAVLGALGRLGFGLIAADLRLGHGPGTGQTLPFHQEIELTPAPRYIHDMNELALTLLTGPDGMEVVLEADKRGRPFSGASSPDTSSPAGSSSGGSSPDRSSPAGSSSGGSFPGPSSPGKRLPGGPAALGRHTVSHEDLEHRDWIAEVDSWIQALIAARTAHTPRAGAITSGITAGTAAGTAGGMVAAGLGDALGNLGSLGNLGDLDDLEGVEGLEGLKDLKNLRNAGHEEAGQG
ncbi:sporulation protein [Streptomyces antimycoticus]|uniref:sporulation protein n=1 Tax=Streptomyces antimycoticus TaxID=68175 RepID=UPI00256FBEA1|nr:sporulation protein [Streptomyces antimycoticus]WJD99523.1 sporulation protein [Streptomyces antimycoticus]